ncbi:MAG: zinc dependent phospholipase C family protein [Cyclobacteriaceae bacterium]
MIRKLKKAPTILGLIVIVGLFSSFAVKKNIWGFYAHKQINRLAVFTLPPEMIGFYKKFVQEIKDNAVNPDMRRYAVKNEAPRHYIDLDVYGDSALQKVPKYWKAAVEKYSEDTLQAYGIVPWHVNRMRYWLTDAFKKNDVDGILRLSSDIGHYIADAHVPLHTTENYNGQLTNQVGIHGLWESRLPELFAEDFDFFVGRAEYLDNPQLAIWKVVEESHLAVDSVLRFERQLTEEFGESKKYGYEERGGLTIRVYSRDFSTEYFRMLDGMVSRRMRASVKMVGNFWFTCWVDAGQPDLENLMDNYTEISKKKLEEQKQEWKKKKYDARSHESE